MGLLKKVCTALLHDSKIAVCGVSAEVKLSKISFFQWSQVSTLHNAPCGLSAAVEGVEYIANGHVEEFDLTGWLRESSLPDMKVFGSSSRLWRRVHVAGRVIAGGTTWIFEQNQL